MRTHRLRLLTVTGALAGAVLVGSAQQLPMEPIKERGQGVTAAFEGWYPNPDGTFTMLVGYFNRNTGETLEIPVGPDNRIEPGGPDRGQPTSFVPRRQWGVFTVVVPKDFGTKRLTWTLTANGHTTQVPLTLVKDYQVNPFEDPAMGNKPPVLRFKANGPELQGPPRGIAAAYSATVGEPLELLFWASDDGNQEPGRPRPGPHVTVSLSKFRGPGSVTFDKARPSVGADGRVAATATFSAPGEYVIRAQANDRTGEGGGGFQCCWTNAHLRVTVRGMQTSTGQ
jgi:hypothetical protein